MKIEHVALQVSDPAAIADWYVEHLGCSVARSTGEPLFIRFLLDGSRSAMLELYHNARAPVPDYRAMDPILIHLAFLSDNVKADRDRLTAAGATIVDDASTTPAGDDIMMMRDPWGLALQLVKRKNPMLTA